ncbi:triple tyrosine motif-containing protein [Flavobacterium degerlachei]|jgi:DNA-binding CsgD family transcriptional regulator/ligand-binding sensor domain-containing protein|uniref:Regulatory protein, luxR family n=1 Tax=Flavobacterium degerlachei TaxID=229203 RepID=A0A1H3G552_9FLAO|nr:triple tyrosine motif-containing protein [Flavobacterium degerlachei]SDX98396.1 regulatory protein, luxR family [Flavobacterium degerlachei]
MNYIELKKAVLGLLLCTSCLFSQVKNIGLPDIRNYKRSDYKGGTQNWNIDQDKYGNLYFANNNGLLQFDGSSWKKYTFPNSASVRSLKIDDSGKIYVGGYNEFGYFEADTKGKLQYFSLSKFVNKETVKLIDFIWKIHILDNEVIFQSFEKAYIYKDKQIKILNAPHRFQFSFLVGKHLYFQDIQLGIVEYKNNQLIPLKGSTLLNNTEIWGIFPMAHKKLLISTLSKGLYTYDEVTGISAWNSEANDFIKKNSSLGGASILKKFIVLNSVLDGMIICDLNGQIIQHINHKNGLQNNTVLASFIDNKKNLWLGLDNGIAFVNESSPFTYFDFSFDLSTVYASIIFDNKLYVATNRGVFYHSWNKTIKENAFTLVEGTTGQAWNLQVINGQLLCAHNRGALIIKGGTVQKSIDNNGYFGFKELPNHPNYIIGSNYNGFSVFEKTTKGWEFKNKIKGFEKSANTFEIDKDNLWLKKDNLLYKMDLSDDLKSFKVIKTYSHLSSKSEGIGSIQRFNQNIYFQTKNAFFKYSQEQDLFYEDKTITALFKNVPPISTVTQDTLGNLWYVFNESLGVFIKDRYGNYKNSIATFSNLTGNIVNNYLSINTVDSANIFIGLTDGLAHYNSDLLKSYITKPKVFIRSFSFSSDTITQGNGKIENMGFKIPYTSNLVRFTFSTPTYENVENVQFSYQLKGFDEKWSPWSTLSLKEYTNLREGDYEMNLKSKNSYGIQSDVNSITFTVSPPWYRHFLMYLLYITAIIGAVYLIRKRIKIKIRKNKYYETIEQRRIYLEKESIIRQEQHHLEKEIEKLKNDKLQIKILTKDKELVNNSLQVVKKNKILNGIIHKLKDINTESFDDSTKFQFNKLNKSITKEVNADKSWKDLEKHIKNVHFDFLKRLKEKYPTISPRELDLSTYLLMNMSTKEIAEIMNISNGGVELARYRLRKKLELNKKENLTGFLMSI